MSRTSNLLPIFALVLALGACARADDPSFYTYRPVIRGDTVYLAKHTVLRGWTPISPEGPGSYVAGSKYQLFAVDLGREDSLRPVSSSITLKPAPSPEFPFATFDAEGNPGIHTPARAATDLRAAAGISCDGFLAPDLQDVRVMYFACPADGKFYRFIEQASKPQIFSLPPELTHIFPHHTVAEFMFHSSAGESKIYLRNKGTNYYEIDLAGGEPRRIDPLAGFDAPPGLQPYDIIAYTPSMRVVTLESQWPEFGVVVLRQGEPPRRHAFTEESLDFTRGNVGTLVHYIADRDMVLWQIGESGEKPRMLLVALDLKTGAYRRTSFLH